ncbi:NAD(P)H-binding protein [Pseudoflavitalea sp. G-6-1-2]|uniref:NmrA family NAD(P)-binding protein n=1 Tax=Pseudoflavitalea sp. G-6-1-2 TaxID=2728841 RepID=UPI00146ACACD|nr:NAD(P)H-binding protein [Pseudoflavitalea sp. G-6-1-2]NML20697.1 NAD(P)H-binding protein [Pseudoflavitalea sp. G-6-1-2]
MYIILGATGHIGSALVKQLVEDGVSVTGVTSQTKNQHKIEEAGAKAAVANVHDAEQLADVFQQGRRLYLLNPPAPIGTDTHKEEETTVDSIVQAISKASFEKIVAESTYGAQPGKMLGDLDVLYNMEQKVKAINANTSVIRGAYYFSNWDGMLNAAIEKGEIYSLYPENFTLPMVAPADIAQLAAKLLQAPEQDNPLVYIEGPRRYSPSDVAAAFENALQKEVKVKVIEESNWMNFLMETGFSEAAAQSMANMTRATLLSKQEPTQYEKGVTTLEKYIRELILNE